MLLTKPKGQMMAGTMKHAQAILLKAHLQLPLSLSSNE
jgi:hypothetical protein